MVSRVLVTGGSGFIGSHVVEELGAQGVEVVVLDRRPLPADVGGVEWVEGDVRDLEAWRAALRGVDAVCHQAARVGVGQDFADAPAYVADNDMGTAVGLAALHGLGFSGRLVLASSMVVYGDGTYACPEHGTVRPAARRPADLDAGRFDPPCPVCGRGLAWVPIDEGAPCDPRTVYAATKHHQEQLCRLFGREHDVPVAMLRYHNVYGPRLPRDTPYAGVAAIFLSAVAAGRAPRVFEDGRQARDFVHVADVARANVAALLASGAPEGPFNVASGQARTVLDVATAMCVGTDLVPAVVGGGRPGDVRHVVASAHRIDEVLGWRASVGFGDGMEELRQRELGISAAAGR